MNGRRQSELSNASKEMQCCDVFAFPSVQNLDIKAAFREQSMEITLLIGVAVALLAIILSVWFATRKTEEKKGKVTGLYSSKYTHCPMQSMSQFRLQKIRSRGE